ncbi:hypothetical protein BH24DEI2_BH24DEI2_12140 [soil metagenome]
MPEYKYTLTRYCLRNGQLTLPQSMLELFPSEGSFKVLDTRQNEEFTLHIDAPRVVGGVDGFFKLHGLQVNDAVLIRLQDDGHYAFTPLVSARAAHGRLPVDTLDSLAEQRVALSEAEMKSLYPQVEARGLADSLARDDRFAFKKGRWHVVDRVAEPGAEPGVKPSAKPTAEAQNFESQNFEPQTSETRPRLDRVEGHEPLRLEAEPRPPRAEVAEAAATVPELPAPKPFEGAFAKLRESAKAARGKRASVTPYPRVVVFPGDTGLNSEQEPGELSLQKRAKSLLVALGYRVEGLAHGQLLAHADLGRRYYSVLVHVLLERTKPDFGALLARRREVGSTYSALFGHALDLTSFEAPAEVARTSLWSWAALGRLENVLDVLPVGPVDLESHFERDGLFEKGFDRFERGVQDRIHERGTFSAVLQHLAVLKAPAVFILDDVLDDEVGREDALKVLDLLGQAPFHLVSKVDSGEFCLRFKVSDALLKLSEYSLSLRVHLPSRRTARFQGSEDGAADFAAEAADEVAVAVQSKRGS